MLNLQPPQNMLIRITEQNYVKDSSATCKRFFYPTKKYSLLVFPFSVAFPNQIHNVK